MGKTCRFLAVNDDMNLVREWFACLPEPPEIINARDGGQFLHFKTFWPMKYDISTGMVDPFRSPVASLFPPILLNGALWTAGEIHFLPATIGEYAKMTNVARRFEKWLSQFDQVVTRSDKPGDWDYYLGGSLRDVRMPLFVLPEAMMALRNKQFFVNQGYTDAAADKLCRSLRMRGIIK